MNQNEPRLVSRAQLARYAGVSRAAVTNWHKRGPDFPEPADAERELFDLDQVTDWLSSRAIPANARSPHEATGTTYADRVRTSAGEETSGRGTGRKTVRSVKEETGRTFEKTVTRALYRLRDNGISTDGYRALLDLVYMCAEHTEAWRELLSHVELPNGSDTLPESVTACVSPRSSYVLYALGAEHLHRTLTEIALLSSGDEGGKKLVTAFDLLLSTWEEDRRAGIVRTPGSLVEAIVGLLVTDDSPLARVHDPFCRTGEFLIAADRRLRNLSPSSRHRLSGAGKTIGETHTAKMNLRIHGVEAHLLEGAVEPGLLPNLPRADLVITNPPFNARPLTAFGPPDAPPLNRPTLTRWDERRFPYGRPPESNANFAWLQHVVTMLAPNGRAGVLMPTNAAFSDHQDERMIRSAMIEAGAVEGVVAFPDRLFPNTSIPVSLWLLRSPTGHCSEMLFIDASDLGSMVSRTRRALLPQDVAAIHAAYRVWRQEADHGRSDISRAVGIEKIREQDYSLHPPSYIVAGHGAEGTRAAQAAERFEQLTRQLNALESHVPETDTRAHRMLQEIHRWIP
ncbi:N-6 DNA methylase [Nocardiopsis synnemataformans]|uniref:N-6 DNA methylase n=1 Tax=Nocardiopsis synnemataformans TaxID=61305 RepID=UPI003EB91D5B